MNTKLNSTITIEGTAFEVDVDAQRLVEKGNPENAISFIEQMVDHGSHYDLAYDPKTRTAFDRSADFNESEDWKLIRVPRLIELDPEGMSARSGQTVAEMKGKTDFEVLVNQEALTLRQHGVLPEVEIDGEKFTVDLRLHELRHSKNHYPALRLKDFDFNGEGDKYVAFYHPATKQIVDLDPRLTEFPDGVIKISIPNELGLDPVSTARIYGINERDLLRRHPIKKDLKAELIPLSETGVPAMIQRNREQLQREHQENAKRIKPKHRPRF